MFPEGRRGIRVPGPPPATLLRSASPNPFSRSVRVAYTLAREGPVRIDIFNVGGQRVVRLLDTVQAAASAPG